MTEKIIKFPINQYSRLPLVKQMEERNIRLVILTGYLASKEGRTQEEALAMLTAEYEGRDVKNVFEQTLRDYIAAGFSLYQERPELTGHEAFHLSKNHYEAMTKHTLKG